MSASNEIDIDALPRVLWHIEGVGRVLFKDPENGDTLIANRLSRDVEGAEIDKIVAEIKDRIDRGASLWLLSSDPEMQILGFIADMTHYAICVYAPTGKPIPMN